MRQGPHVIVAGTTNGSTETGHARRESHKKFSEFRADELNTVRCKLNGAS
jgi:hypothetical protein